MTKAELIKEFKEKAGLASIAEADKAYASLFSILKNELKNGGQVAISGFGTFKVSSRAARKGRNPQTGKEIDIPASKAVKFAISKPFKDELN